MYTYNKVSGRGYLSQLFPVTDLACVKLVHSCMTTYHTYYFENQHIIDFFRAGRTGIYIRTDCRNRVTSAILSKVQSSVVCKFPRTNQVGNHCFSEARRPLLFSLLTLFCSKRTTLDRLRKNIRPSFILCK